MEILSALEKKIEGLVELIRALREENSKISKENQELQIKMSQLEEALLKESGRIELELSEERSTTRRVVDDLIKSIDSLIENGDNR